FDPPADGQLPAVLIGTIVELEDLNNQDRLTLRLINPFCLDILPEDISFLSEPGKQLLMKKVGDIVTLQIHSTTKLWRISAVKPDYQELGSPFLCPG
ncbi:MAG TPA: GreA/GreB family elongation factor, partial [Bacillota bacterium]